MSLTMKRRRFVKSLAAVAPAATLIAQQAPAPGNPGQPAPGVPLNPAQPVQPPAPRPAGELPKIDVTVADVAADPTQKFFTPVQFAALRKLSSMLMPPLEGRPGALEAKAPEFLDFLMSRSPADEQQVYKAGLDALNGQAMKRFKKNFADVDAAQADELLAPLRAPFTGVIPTEPLARFLHAAKRDVRTATVNSREYAAAGGSGGRRFSGAGLYWFPLD